MPKELERLKKALDKSSKDEDVEMKPAEELDLGHFRPGLVRTRQPLLWALKSWTRATTNSSASSRTKVALWGAPSHKVNALGVPIGLS